MIIHVIEGFDIRLIGSSFCTCISDDSLRGNISGIDYGTEIHLADDILEVGAIDFGDDLCTTDTTCVQGEEYILLIDSGKGDEGVNRFEPFFTKQILVSSVTIYDDSLREEFGEFLTASLITLDDLHGDAHMDELEGEVISTSSTTDDHTVTNDRGLETKSLEERLTVSSGKNEGENVTGL